MRDCHLQVAKYQREEVRLPNESRKDIFARAKTNRKRLKDGLAANEDPTPIGQRTQGSYAMRTMIVENDEDYDIDDGVYFKKEDLVGPKGGDKTPLAAREMVWDALQDDRFNIPPEVLKNCVRVYYNEGYHIDVPVYRHVVVKDAWTGKESDHYELASSNWKRSDALAVTSWFQDFNKDNCDNASKDGDKGQFVEVVRLLKAFARSRSSWKGKISNGFVISKLVADHWAGAADRDDKTLRNVAKAIRDKLSWSQAVKHPVLDENIIEDGNAKANFLHDKLDEKLKHLDVLDEWDCDHEKAMSAWDKFFNSDWFSQQPDPDGAKSLTQKVGPAVKRGETRYA
ncbi:cyclic GMP-AMP synthase DncV-like nucleotidyltransferase [Mesorhizobium calcicola]|uniref:Cyclic GMP-AMP synthase n=1 Tax=Mesorhizobium calcicola TaxID=1300310 RepID=A0ABW4W6Q0_9HYPH